MSHSELAGLFGADAVHLVCCVSFEDRSKALPMALLANKGTKASVFYNMDVSEGAENLEDLRSQYDDCCSFREVLISSPTKTADTFVSELTQLEGLGKKLVVDVSTFTHEHLLILVQCLKYLSFDLANIFWVYCRVREYSITEKGEEKWLSQGVSDVRTVLGYSGNISAELPTYLIALVGFESHRAIQVIETVEPAKLLLGKGASSESESVEMAVINERFHEMIFRERSQYSEEDIEPFEFSCNDLPAVTDIIQEFVRKYKGLGNIIVLPMNTKISTLGVAVAFQRDPSFRVIYAQADSYNTQSYSEASDRCYILENIFS